MKGHPRYDINMLYEAAKRKQLEKRFPKGLQADHDMGRLLVELAAGRSRKAT